MNSYEPLNEALQTLFRMHQLAISNGWQSSAKAIDLVIESIRATTF